MKADGIWILYIDFETQFGHWGFVNLLCYMAAQTPLLKHQIVIDKYMEVLDNYYDGITEDIKNGSFEFPDRYADY